MTIEVQHEVLRQAIYYGPRMWESLFLNVKAIADMEGANPDSHIQALEAASASACVTLGEFARYLMHRGAAGCGDRGHEDALEYAREGEGALRRAAGYSYL